MSNEQGFSKLPNDVLDVLMAELSGNAFKVYMAIFRKTAGFNKASDNIPMSQLGDHDPNHKPTPKNNPTSENTMKIVVDGLPFEVADNPVCNFWYGYCYYHWYRP